MKQQALKTRIPISYPAVFYGFLKEQGLPADRIFDEVGIDRLWFDDPNKKITLEHYTALSRRTLELSKNPAMGLLFGSYLSLQAHNYLGFAIQSCSCAAEAIRLMCKYTSTRFPHIDITYTEEKNSVVVRVEDLLCDSQLSIYNLEIAIASIHKGALTLQLMDSLQANGSPVSNSKIIDTITEIQFGYREPEYIEAYHDSFPQQTLSFNHGSTRIVYDKKTLNTPYSFGNSTSCKMAEAQCQAELIELSANENITSKIQHIFFENASQFPSLESLAKQFNMSTRVLSRRLREENTSYQEVLDQTRARLSVKYLETTDLSVAEIAYRLGYEHPTNFTRAFRKWTNKSPSDYRPEQTRPE